MVRTPTAQLDSLTCVFLTAIVCCQGCELEWLGTFRRGAGRGRDGAAAARSGPAIGASAPPCVSCWGLCAVLRKELGEAHPVSSYCTSALGLARHKRGDLQAAETLYSDALAHQVRSLPSALGTCGLGWC